MIYCQEVVWVVRWEIQQTILGTIGVKLEEAEGFGTSQKRKGEADCDP